MHPKLAVQQGFRPVELSLLLKDRQTLFWFLLSLSVPLYFGVITWLYLLNQDYSVQDDARQHVVFLQRFVDGQLFPHDRIADYFETMAPFGYKSLYWVGAKLGIAPVGLAKVLPILLSFVTTIYLFFICLHLFPIPISGFLSSLILNQHLWMNDDLVSATPRAFIYPICAAFLYYLLERSLFPLLITIALQGLFFPQLVFVQVLILLLRIFRWRRLQRSTHQEDYIFGFAGTLVAGLVLLPYALHVSEFGTALTAAQMQSMPEYGLVGRNQYFGVGWWQFWFWGNSGIRIPWFPSVILVGLGLPLLGRSRSPLVDILTKETRLLGQVVIASFSMYGLAHLFLLKLHFPSRYTYHTLRIILAIAAGIVLTVLLDAGWRWLRYRRRIHPRLNLGEKALLGLTASLIGIMVLVPAIPQLFLPFQGWVVGEAPAIYEYLDTQPQDTLVASLAPDANNLPAFTQRSTLVGREFALPHHPNYYDQFTQRAVDLIRAQYSSEIADVIKLIDRYDIDFFLLERHSLNPDYLLNQDWLIHSSFQETVLETIDQLKQGNRPALSYLIDQCSAASTERLVLVEAVCIKQTQSLLQ